MHAAISTRSDAIAKLCRRYHVWRLDIFGSATRDQDFDPARSDADVLVAFEPDIKPTIALLLDVEDALREAPGRPVDLIERRVIETGPNYLHPRRILHEAEPLHVAG